MITSTGNNRVRSVSALAKKAKIRREQGLFIVEGAKMFAELPKDRLKETYVSESFLRQHGEKASELLQGICFEEVSDDVMKYMSDTQTPQGIRLYAAHLKGKVSYENEDYRTDTGFLIGNEANGLTEETAAMADCYVRIPMAGQVESLNAAVAASILMFETARQRRN